MTIDYIYIHTPHEWLITSAQVKKLDITST